MVSLLKIPISEFRNKNGVISFNVNPIKAINFETVVSNIEKENPSGEHRMDKI
jgi:hypothetical protein